MDNTTKAISISVRKSAGEKHDSELVVILRPADQIEVDIRLWHHDMQMPVGRYEYTTTRWDTMSYELACEAVQHMGSQRAESGPQPKLSTDIPDWLIELLENFDPV